MNIIYTKYLSKILFATIGCLLNLNTFSSTWNVGASQIYTALSQVSSLVQNGDTIFIDGGIYINDAVKWTKNNLTFIGLGTGNNRTILQFTTDIPNRKGIFVFENPGLSDNAYIENIVFDGAQIADADGANGAGIRFQSENLTINNCKFVNCQNGILEGNAGVNSSNVIIKNSEFENNGYQLPNDPNFSGYEHHIYISASTDTLIVENCYFHHPRGQANSLKTRAQRSFILYNLIDEEATGYGSWEINIAQGGMNIIMGNIIIQGTSGANHGIVGYDAVTNQLEDFYFINNTVINKYPGNIKYFNIAPASGINTFRVYNNIFASVPGANNTMYTGNIPSVIDSGFNIGALDYLTIGFTNPAINDYSLLSTAVPVDLGGNAGSTNTGYLLTPIYMYQSFNSPLLSRSISGSVIDIGAYEYSQVSGVVENEPHSKISICPNPSTGIIKFISVKTSTEIFDLTIFNQTGQIVFQKSGLTYESEVNLTTLAKGNYLAKLFYRSKSIGIKFEIR